MLWEVFGLNPKYYLAMYVLAPTHDVLNLRIICRVTK